MNAERYDLLVTFVKKAEEFVSYAQDVLEEFGTDVLDKGFATQAKYLRRQLDLFNARIKNHQRVVRLIERTVASTS